MKRDKQHVIPSVARDLGGRCSKMRLFCGTFNHRGHREHRETQRVKVLCVSRCSLCPLWFERDPVSSLHLTSLPFRKNPESILLLFRNRPPKIGSRLQLSIISEPERPEVDGQAR